VVGQGVAWTGKQRQWLKGVQAGRASGRGLSGAGVTWGRRFEGRVLWRWWEPVFHSQPGAACLALTAKQAAKLASVVQLTLQRWRSPCLVSWLGFSDQAGVRHGVGSGGLAGCGRCFARPQRAAPASILHVCLFAWLSYLVLLPTSSLPLRGASLTPPFLPALGSARAIPVARPPFPSCSLRRTGHAADRGAPDQPLHALRGGGRLAAGEGGGGGRETASGMVKQMRCVRAPARVLVVGGSKSLTDGTGWHVGQAGPPVMLQCGQLMVSTAMLRGCCGRLPAPSQSVVRQENSQWWEVLLSIRVPMPRIQGCQTRLPPWSTSYGLPLRVAAHESA
jgi:hypothetical protein